jgi:6-pyruvoyltetrahydropterin/6-carboxytetrahydropterin synthase
MKVKIGKDFVWEMSHRLPFHEGPCKNIHGHTYKMTVELIGDVDTNGMVLDYYNVCKIVDPFIAKLDHAFICDDNDTNVIDFLKNQNFKHYIIPNNTTSELMAIYFIEEFASKFKQFNNIDTLILRIYETSDAYAEVSVSLK